MDFAVAVAVIATVRSSSVRTSRGGHGILEQAFASGGVE